MKNEILKIRSLKPSQIPPYVYYIQRMGEFQSKGGLIASGHGNMPPFAKDDSVEFFLASAKGERRNGAAAREMVIPLANELSTEQMIKVVEKGIALDLKNKAYMFGIHGDEGNPHVHILYSDRVNDGIEREPQQYFKRHNASAPERGGCKKDSGGKHPRQLGAELAGRKIIWASVQNAQLESNGHTRRIDFTSKQKKNALANGATAN